MIIRDEIRKDFARELSSLINRYGVDADVGIEDFLLTDMIINQMFIWAQLARLRGIASDGSEAL